MQVLCMQLVQSLLVGPQREVEPPVPVWSCAASLVSPEPALPPLDASFASAPSPAEESTGIGAASSMPRIELQACAVSAASVSADAMRARVTMSFLPTRWRKETIDSRRHWRARGPSIARNSERGSSLAP